MSKFVYVLTHDVAYEGSHFMGVFSTMRLAKEEAGRAWPCQTLKWVGNRKESYADIGSSDCATVTKVRVDETNY